MKRMPHFQCSTFLIAIFYGLTAVAIDSRPFGPLLSNVDLDVEVAQAALRAFPV